MVDTLIDHKMFKNLVVKPLVALVFSTFYDVFLWPVRVSSIENYRRFVNYVFSLLGPLNHLCLNINILPDVIHIFLIVLFSWENLMKHR